LTISQYFSLIILPHPAAKCQGLFLSNGEKRAVKSHCSQKYSVTKRRWPFLLSQKAQKRLSEKKMPHLWAVALRAIICSRIKRAAQVRLVFCFLITQRLQLQCPQQLPRLLPQRSQGERGWKGLPSWSRC